MVLFFFFKQKPAYEMRISDWSSDVCSSDLPARLRQQEVLQRRIVQRVVINACLQRRRRVDCRPALDRRREKTPPEGLVAQGELVRCQRAGFDLGLQQGCAIRRKALRRQRLADSLALQQPKRALPLPVKGPHPQTGRASGRERGVPEG